VKKSVAVSVLATMTALTALVGPSAVEARSVPKLTGGVALSNPPQFAQFNGIKDGGAGSVTYTNFDEPVTDTDVNVWSVAGEHVIHFQVENDAPGSANVVVDSIVALSPTASRFSGHWEPGDENLVFEGVVSGTGIEWQLFDEEDQLVASATGTIDPSDGSLAGNGTEPDPLPPFTWSADAGTAHRVFNFTAPITCANVDLTAKTAKVLYDVPDGDGFPYEGNVLFRVKDGGKNGTGDTYEHAGVAGDATCSTSPTFYSYDVIGGDLKVH
jgi:hypothetical protein